jgi:hypothetical protein
MMMGTIVVVVVWGVDDDDDCDDDDNDNDDDDDDDDVRAAGELINCVGMCERILMTQVPKSYSRHTSRFLSIYSLTLPLVLVQQLGVFTPPVVSEPKYAARNKVSG